MSETRSKSVEDFTQSANVLFHFMKKPDYLKNVLLNRAIIPRYCLEDVSYLGLVENDVKYTEVAILEKCFCDIPFHKLMQPFDLEVIGEGLSEEEKDEIGKGNTHPDCYGQYGIAFSKRWGEARRLQPVQYINERSETGENFSDLFSKLTATDDLSDEYGKDFLIRLSTMKPLRGIMTRDYERTNGETIQVKIQKNFYDEQEWRYIPNFQLLEDLEYRPVIANPNLLHLDNMLDLLNENLESEKFKPLWLNFVYDDIRYIIVPNTYERRNFIDFIMKLADTQFVDPANKQSEQLILISKILTFDEIRKDW